MQRRSVGHLVRPPAVVHQHVAVVFIRMPAMRCRNADCPLLSATCRLIPGSASDQTNESETDRYWHLLRHCEYSRADRIGQCCKQKPPHSGSRLPLDEWVSHPGLASSRYGGRAQYRATPYDDDRKPETTHNFSLA
ncbi:hypothetical protein CCHOA_09720 [Corynebacterium choanae]|uniref:Uncharacterized protein n=1 Tax=Corynebacterium choanae TaxID=1862358 RepID=A0A3G6J8D7_9CORY|nr:hypothetical protein CCHOA_09720 [Corynebacterium choanae]